MADDAQDESEKTEQPTARRLEEAMKKGQVVSSKEVNNFLMLFTLALIIVWVLPHMMEYVGIGFSKYITSPQDIEVSEENAKLILIDVLMNFMKVMFPVIIAGVIAALASGFIQHPPIISGEAIMPKLSKISPLAGLKRLFSLRQLTEFLKGILKIVLVGAVAYVVLLPLKKELDLMVTFDIAGILSITYEKSLKIMIGVLIFMAVIAVMDYLYQKYEHTKNLRMSRHEIKEEHKQTEGDPQVKARLKQIRMERIRRRMMAAVPEASVVITNPTHFSVALKYELDKMAAPVVVAKGLDLVALKIREIAKESKVPIVENPPLARALYDAVDIDEQIPLEYYQAVAEVISYVYKMKQKRAA